jgi:hypothetical protein
MSAMVPKGASGGTHSYCDSSPEAGQWSSGVNQRDSHGVVRHGECARGVADGPEVERRNGVENGASIFG